LARRVGVDVGAEVFVDGRTYDQLLGEPARAADAPRWCGVLYDAVSGFVAEFAATTVHFGGGNARCVDVTQFGDLGVRVVLNDNDAALRGATLLGLTSCPASLGRSTATLLAS
jgi:hypothetical protein